MPARRTERRGVGRKDGEEMEKRRGVEVFIVRESGESANPLRYPRTGHAKPEQAHTRPEAGKRAPFTRTQM